MSSKEENGHSLNTLLPVDEEADVLDGQDLLLREESEQSHIEEHREVLGESTLSKFPDMLVGVRVGRTINIGNYESFRIDFWKAAKCNKDEEEETLERIKKDCLNEVGKYVKLTNEKLGRSVN